MNRKERKGFAKRAKLSPPPPAQLFFAALCEYFAFFAVNLIQSPLALDNLHRVTQTITDRKHFGTQLRMVNEILIKLPKGVRRTLLIR